MEILICRKRKCNVKTFTANIKEMQMATHPLRMYNYRFSQIQHQKLESYQAEQTELKRITQNFITTKRDEDLEQQEVK